MRAERARLSRHAEVAKAMDYMLKLWPAFARFIDDGRICLTNNAVEDFGPGRACEVSRWGASPLPGARNGPPVNGLRGASPASSPPVSCRSGSA